MAKYMNSSQPQAEKSIGMLKEMKFQWICPGHGLPIQKDDKWGNFIKNY